MSYEQQSRYISQRLMNFTGEGLDTLALEVFRFQARHNATYAEYLSLLGIPPSDIRTVADIPFLPVSFFKTHCIKTGKWPARVTFTSSGTTGPATSRHPVRDIAFYKKNTERGFERFYGHPSGFRILALLPSYIERTGSSLLCMANHFIGLSTYPESGFFLHHTDELLKALEKSKKDRTPTLLLGVSFALLNLAENYPLNLKGITVMETGGMKGRRKEITREKLHQTLTAAFNLPAIHSEYGMTELFSQAYSKGGGRFLPPPTMKVLAREITDPLTPQKTGKTGALNIIDLANFNTISFIATDDLGRIYPDGSFEVLGRLDHSDIRGCNLLLP